MSRFFPLILVACLGLAVGCGDDSEPTPSGGGEGGVGGWDPGSGGSGGDDPGAGGSGGDDPGAGGSGGDDPGAGGSGGDLCEAITCESIGATCGEVDDACGGVIDCGSCDEHERCDDNQCVCVPESDAELCDAAGANCGALSVTDRCGKERVIDSCGTCAYDEECKEQVCVCRPETDEEICDAVGAVCGAYVTYDRCQVLRTVDSCGTCGEYEACDNNQCECVPEEETELCEQVGAVCGSVVVEDRCGEERTIESCGTCSLTEACEFNECVCAPETDAELCIRNGAVCGELHTTDRCGEPREVKSCGTCGLGEACEENACVCVDDPTEDLCGLVGAHCGAVLVANSCGNVKLVENCGTCPEGQACGVGGPNQCGVANWDWEVPQSAEDLRAVYAVDANTVLAAGDNGALLRWDGTGLATEEVPTRADILDVWGDAPDSLWAVGEDGTLLRGNGRVWAVSYLTRSEVRDLVAVSGTGADDVWFLAQGSPSALLHWDGQTLSEKTQGLQGSDRLNHLAADSHWGVWAAGDDGLVVHWDRGNESFDRHTPQTVAGVHLQRVWTDPNEPAVWVTGTQGGLTDIPVTARLTGQSWDRVNDTGFSPFGDFPLALWAPPGENPFMLTRGASENRLYRWGGQVGWHIQETLPARMFGVHGVPGGSLWLVGENGSFVELEDGGDEYLPLTDEPPSCNRLYGAGDYLWAGCGDTVLQSDGRSWVALPPFSDATSPQIWALWASGPNDLWVVIRSGTYNSRIYSWDGSAWTMEKEYFFESVMAIWGDGAGQIWIGGQGSGATSRIRLFDGSNWTAVAPSSPSSVVRGLWGIGGEMWAAAVGGNILSSPDGVTWTNSRPGSDNFHAIHGSAADDVWAVGQSGQAYHWNGSSWTRRNAGSRDLESVYVAPSGDAYAVNADGVLYHWNGTDWSTTRIAQPSTAKAVWQRPNGSLVVAGDGIQSRP